MRVNAINAALGSMGFGNDEIAGNRFGELAWSVFAEGAKVSINIIEIQLSRKTKAPNDTIYDRCSFSHYGKKNGIVLVSDLEAIESSLQGEVHLLTK